MSFSSRDLPLELIKQQRSHLLVVLTDAEENGETDFLAWFQNAYRIAMSETNGVLRVAHYEQSSVDITQGEYRPLPFRYLGIYEISVDGASAAEPLIDQIVTLHRKQPTAKVPATWLYYPASERAGRAPMRSPSMLTLAFANPVAGQETEFVEWYATRHIRHALNIQALVSGQCFRRTHFQKPGALAADFHTIAVYEQEGSAESIVDSFKTLPESTFHFPALDLVKFAEWVYRPLPVPGDS